LHESATAEDALGHQGVAGTAEETTGADPGQIEGGAETDTGAIGGTEDALGAMIGAEMTQEAITRIAEIEEISK